MSEDQIVFLLDYIQMGARSLAAIAVAVWLGACSTSSVNVKIVKDEEDE